MELKDGEVLCDKCEGDGEIKYTDEKFFIRKRTCEKCYGDGKLDWLENITGKKEPLPWFCGQPGNPKRFERWTFASEFNKVYKMSSEEIIQSVNPNYIKKLERKNAYNVAKK